MKASFDFQGVDNFSYQHVQGVMLLNLNKTAAQIRLSHSEYRVMAVIIGLWNKKQNKAFPTIDYLSNICCMGKATLLKNLNKLVMHNLLVVVKTKGKRNNYYLGKKIFNPDSTSHVEPKSSFTCGTTNKQYRNNNKIEKTISFNKKKHTGSLNNTKISEMLKFKYWKHKPSSTIVQVKPDIGNHILIRYDKNKDFITIIDDEKKSDYLKNFVPINNNNKQAPENEVNKTNYSKEELIDKLIEENKVEEANNLIKLFKMKSYSITKS